GPDPTGRTSPAPGARSLPGRPHVPAARGPAPPARRLLGAGWATHGPAGPPPGAGPRAAGRTRSRGRLAAGAWGCGHRRRRPKTGGADRGWSVGSYKVLRSGGGIPAAARGERLRLWGGMPVPLL